MSLVNLVEKLIYLLFLSALTFSKAQDWNDILAKIYVQNGWKVARFPYFQNRQLNTVKTFMKYGMQIHGKKCIGCQNIQTFGNSDQHIFYDGEPEKLTIFGPIQRIQLNTSFYIFTPNDEQKKIQAFFAINTGKFSKPIIQELEFTPNNYKLQTEDFPDFQGQRLKGITNEFPPYIINPCSKLKTVECSSNEKPLKGLYIDYITMLADLLNFTFSIDTNPDWGIVSTQVETHQYQGVLGGIINNEYDFSISNWLWTLDRDKLLDFVPIDYGNTVLSITPKRKALDFALFIRPFTHQAWIAILLTTTACFFTLIIPYIFVKAYELGDAHMTAATATWLLFTLINAYYSGALTMFFSTKEQVPFSSIQDVIRAYPGESKPSFFFRSVSLILCIFSSSHRLPTEND